ncbi:MAG TPA: choice-of-anchor Q domain-containing protein [Anaerolineales bacterium]|nr:choice-of-anchor Q domain-containing protein [Anaerolineales bacterium]
MTPTERRSARPRGLWLKRLGAIGCASALVASAFVTTPQPVLAATITVTTTVDELNTDGDCSLREAIQAANTNAAVDACPAGSASTVDIIYLADASYALGIPGTGEDLNVTGDLDVKDGSSIQIQGAPFGATEISGGFGDRVFDVLGPTGSLDLAFVAIRNGLTFEEPGAGIRSNAELTLYRVVIEQNNVLGNTSGSIGGGLCLGCGSGAGSASIEASSIRSNSARAGGGIFSSRPISVVWSSVISNTASLNAGGVYSYDTLTLAGSLIGNNTSPSGTGGLVNEGVVTATNVTFSHNSGAAGQSGGIRNFGTVTIGNAIVANNTPTNCGAEPGVSSTGHNISSDASCATFFAGAGDLNSTGPLLGDLQANGFGAIVRPLLPTSPAVDAADPAQCAVRDQRLFPSPIDGDGNGLAVCDIGAFEYAPRLYVQPNTSGFQDGLTWSTAMSSLQDALAFATRGTEIWVAQGLYFPDNGVMQTPNARSATFSMKDLVNLYGGFAGHETTLAQRDPAAFSAVLSGDLLQNDVNTDGNWVAERYTDQVGADNAYHVVTAGSGLFGTLDGFIITGGNADGGSPNNVGGGLYNAGSQIALRNLVFSGNSAVGGGGLLNTGSGSTLTNAVFVGNFGTFGGGMQNDGGSNGTLTNVTFSGNVGGLGGGLFNANSNPLLVNVTFSGNAGSSGSGGGLHNANSAPRLINTLIADSVSGGDCVNSSGGFIAAGSVNNLIEEGGSACGLVDGVNGDRIGQDALLGPLATGGGPTRTHPLLPGSPAINAGSNTDCPTTDQLGTIRPLGGTCDIGAYEYGNFKLVLPSLRK